MDGIQTGNIVIAMNGSISPFYNKKVNEANKAAAELKQRNELTSTAFTVTKNPSEWNRRVTEGNLSI